MAEDGEEEVHATLTLPVVRTLTASGTLVVGIGHGETWHGLNTVEGGEDGLEIVVGGAGLANVDVSDVVGFLTFKEGVD